VNNAELERIRGRWNRALLSKHGGEYMQAEVSRDIWSAHGEDPRVSARGSDSYEVLSRIGVAPSSKGMCRNMAVAIDVVPDRDVWVAVGWRGVKSLTNATKRERERAIKQIRKEAQGGKLPKSVALRIVPGERRSPRPEVRGTELDAKVLLAELRWLVAAGYLGLAALSPEVRNAVSKRATA